MLRWLIATACVPLCFASLRAVEPNPAAIEYFEKSIRPILVENCTSCHGAKKQQGSLRLDTAEGFAKGTDGMPVVVLGKPEQSRLIASVERKGDYPMPPDGVRLNKEQIAALTEWVKQGAIFPANTTATVGDPKKLWAFQPVIDPKVPAIAGVKNPIDAFVSAKLTEKGMTPAAPADRRTLARRLYYGLIGLPPTAADLDRFEKGSETTEQLVDTLLKSPQYGERWGRYWLDVARYADTKGYVFQEDRNYPYAYTYRDYVIRSLNEDKPFNRFIVEQLAADKLTLGDDKKPLAAMGFLTLGRRFSNNSHDIIDDRIDTVTRGLMGLTVACARCHDHKYDPIPAADYYSLYGVLASSNEPKEYPLIGEVERTPEFLKFETDLQKFEAAVAAGREKMLANRQSLLGSIAGSALRVPNPEKLLNRADRNSLTDLQKKADQFKAKSPFAPPRAMVLNDNTRPNEPAIFLRGNPNTRGATVPRRMPEIVVGATRKPFANGSGRLELAEAIASDTNPLTARVIVNRVWGWHFGQALVRTPSDFGVRSEPPTHPELLDWLTKRFIEDGWSLKKLHKRILSSATYQQASATPAASFQADPENRWLAHQNRRRLDFEGMRDSLLVAAGQLDAKLYGRSIDLFAQPFTKRRTVYASIDRQNLPGTFRAFDLASPEQHTAQRFQTTVPQQALYLMNNAFVAERARAVVAREDVAKVTDPVAKAVAIYRAILSRDPNAGEATFAAEFVQEAGKVKPTGNQLSAWEQFAQVLLLSNEFLFVD